MSCRYRKITKLKHWPALAANSLSAVGISGLRLRSRRFRARSFLPTDIFSGCSCATFRAWRWRRGRRRLGSGSDSRSTAAACVQPACSSCAGLPINQSSTFGRLFFCITRKMGAVTVASRWDEKAGLRRDAVGSQVIDVLEAQEIKETGNEEG
jgi:hypothetical protein